MTVKYTNIKSAQHKIIKKENKKNVYYIKTFVGDMCWWTFDDTDLFKRELRAIKFCQTNNIPHPKTKYDVKNKTIIMEECPGVCATECLNKNSINIFYKIGKTLADLHSYPIDDLDADDVSLNNYFKTLKTKIKDLSEKENFLKQIKELELRLTSSRKVFLHGDFHVGNVLINKDNQDVSAILDWEFSAIGDPETDVLIMMNSIAHKANDKNVEELLINSFLKGYVNNIKFKLTLDDLELWRKFLELRDEIISAWVLHESSLRTLNTTVDPWLI